jgi:hypothetical protein
VVQDPHTRREREGDTDGEPVEFMSGGITCAVCGTFQGDEEAVARHVDTHFETKRVRGRTSFRAPRQYILLQYESEKGERTSFQKNVICNAGYYYGKCHGALWIIPSTAGFWCWMQLTFARNDGGNGRGAR